MWEGFKKTERLFLSMTKKTRWTRQGMRCGRGGGMGILGGRKSIYMHGRQGKVGHVWGVDSPFCLEITKEMKKNASERIMGNEAGKLNSK